MAPLLSETGQHPGWCSGTPEQLGLGNMSDHEMHDISEVSTQSAAYHGDDGAFFPWTEQLEAMSKSEDGVIRGQPFGPHFGSEDGHVVGVGIDFTRDSLFFSCDGKLVGERVVPHIRLEICEFCVGMHSKGEHVAINLGTRPFAFDVHAYAHNLPVRCCGDEYVALSSIRDDKNGFHLKSSIDCPLASPAGVNEGMLQRHP